MLDSISVNILLHCLKNTEIHCINAPQIVATVKTRQRGKLVSSAALNKSLNNGFTQDQHLSLAARVDDLYKYAIPLGEYNDVNSDQNVKAIFRFAAPARIDGKIAFALLTLKRSEGNKLYSLELEEINQLGGTLDRLKHLLKEEPSTIPLRADGDIVAELAAKVKEYFGENALPAISATEASALFTNGTLQAENAIKEWAPQAYQNYLNTIQQDGNVSTFSIKAVNTEAQAALTFESRTKTQAKEIRKELERLKGKKLKCKNSPLIAEVGSEQRGKLVSDKARNKSLANGFTVQQHMTLAANVDKLYEYAIPLGEYHDKNARRNVEAIFRFACPVNIDGQTAFALLTLKRTDGNKLYSIELEEINQLGGTLDKVSHLLKEEPSHIPLRADGDIVAELAAKVKEYFGENALPAISATEASALFTNGTLQTENAIITQPGATHSIAAADNLRQHYAENPNGTPPEGWWVHGRRGQDNLNTEHVLQLTRRNEVGEQYAGSNGSVWYIRPKANAPILDTRNPEHIQQLRNFVKSELENYDSPIYSDYEHVLLDEKREEITDEDIDKVLSHFIPQDIVNSAEAYDNPEWVQRLWNALEVGFIITPDGAVVLDPMAIEAVRVDEDAEYPGEAPVSFSVIGPKAKTWDKYKERAFTGRDDGMQRAEIDASQARLNHYNLHGENVTAYHRLVQDWENIPQNDRRRIENYASQIYEWREESEKLNNIPESEFLAQHNKVENLRNALKPKREKIRSLLYILFKKHGGSDSILHHAKDTLIDDIAVSLWGPVTDEKVVRQLGHKPWNGVRLADILHYPELYQAYPQLQDTTVYYEDIGNTLGGALYEDGENAIEIHESLHSDYPRQLSVLLHEIQHHIQNIEGFAKGGNTTYARDFIEARAAMGDLDAREIRHLPDIELYYRFAGEIESRNVQLRRDWTAEQRAARPFNETLEYPGEALVTYSIQSIMTDWSAELDNFVQNPPVHKSAAWDADVYVCPTPAVMQMVGALPRDMVMSHHVLAKVLDEHTVLGNGQTTGQMYGKEKDMGKHQLTVAELRKLPLALANPVCIAVSNHKGSIEVITDMEENGINVLVAVRLDASLRSTPKLVVNRITSLYGKKKIEQLVKHPMLYVNTAKAHRWMVDRGLQLPTVTKLSAGSTGRILTPEDLVKYKIATGQSFSLSGRGMIDAVDLGVMAREGQMQRLVSHARREAARWERTFAKDTPNAKAAEAMGTISSIQAAILRVLPPKYRPALAAQMRYVEVYARMLESGRVRAYGKLKSEELAALKEELGELNRGIDDVVAVKGQELDRQTSAEELAKEYGEMQLQEAMEAIMHRVAGQLRKHADTEVYAFLLDVRFYVVCAKGDGSIARSRVSSGPCSARRARAR